MSIIELNIEIDRRMYNIERIEKEIKTMDVHIWQWEREEKYKDDKKIEVKLATNINNYYNACFSASAMQLLRTIPELFNNVEKDCGVFYYLRPEAEELKNTITEGEVSGLIKTCNLTYRNQHDSMEYLNKIFMLWSLGGKNCYKTLYQNFMDYCLIKSNKLIAPGKDCKFIQRRSWDDANELQLPISSISKNETFDKILNEFIDETRTDIYDFPDLDYYQEKEQIFNDDFIRSQYEKQIGKLNGLAPEQFYSNIHEYNKKNKEPKITSSRCEKYEYVFGKYILISLKIFEKVGDFLNKFIPSIIFDKEDIQIHNKKYTIMSIIIHQGTGIRSGHYIANCKRGDKWYRFNSSENEPKSINFNDFSDGSPYIILLKRAD